MAWYAWSPIVGTNKENGQSFNIKVGSAVSKGDLPSGEWDDLIDAGVIREDKYPETRYGESPRETIIREANEMMDNAKNLGTKRSKAGSKAKAKA